MDHRLAASGFEVAMYPINRNKYTQIEYERRFLLEALPSDVVIKGGFVKIVDLYIPNTRLRLRRMESPEGELAAAKLTQKYRVAEQDVFECTITNIYLNADELATFAKIAGENIIKRRYKYLFKGEPYSIDVFEDKLAGLILCEIEKRSKTEIVGTEMPSFALKEVSDNPAYSGGRLVNLTQVAFEEFIRHEINIA